MTFLYIGCLLACMILSLGSIAAYAVADGAETERVRKWGLRISIALLLIAVAVALFPLVAVI